MKTSVATFEPPPYRWVYLNGRGIDRYTRRVPHPATTLNDADWAHGAWSALAQTFGELLRKRFHDHVEEHGCGCSGGRWCEHTDDQRADPYHAGGVGHCPTGRYMFSLLPDGDQVLTA